MRLGVIAALLTSSAVVGAEPPSRVEATGFMGVADFSKDIGLGNAPALALEQRPQTAPTFGGRVTYIAAETTGDLHLDFGVEAELSFTPAWTGYGFANERMSYFAPVLGYRANLLLRLGGGAFQPHVLGGAGAATVVSDSPFMTKETDPVFAWGVGAVIAMGDDGWQLRVDGRQILGESISGGTTSSYELLLAAGLRFGARRSRPADETRAAAPTAVVENLPDPSYDTDRDGVVDRVDACPQQAEEANGVDDSDGCPEPDPDGDKLVAGADRCPERAEDVDGFEDADGCPEDDNDKDGIADAADACANAPETRNGVRDDDGCPDQVPAGFLAALASAHEVTFDLNRARVTSRAKAALDAILAAMRANPKLEVRITAHPDGDGVRPAELAKKRAENVKWYLVEQGIPARSLTTAVATVAKNGPAIVLTIAP